MIFDPSPLQMTISIVRLVEIRSLIPSLVELALYLLEPLDTALFPKDGARLFDYPWRVVLEAVFVNRADRVKRRHWPYFGS